MNKPKIDVRSELIAQMEAKEPDSICGIYNNDSIGVKRVIDSGLYNFERILARKEDTNIYGLPLNKILEVYGKFDSCKCFSKDNYIFLESGIYTVEEMADLLNQKLFTCVKTINVAYKRVALVNEWGNNELISDFTFNGKKKVLKITTEHGLVLEITKNHPLRTIIENGFICWKKSSDLKIGDHLICKTNTTKSNIECDKNKLFCAYIAGVFIADGYIGERKIGVTNNDPDILRQIFNFFEIYSLPIRKYLQNNGSTYDIHYNINRGNKVKELLGLKIGIAKDKEVPLWARTSGRDIMINFLRGYLDCESYISKNCLSVSSASYKLLHEVQLMLWSLNIISTMTDCRVKGYEENNYYKLCISGTDLDSYVRIIGTNSNYRKKQISKRCNVKSDYSGIPFQKDNLRVLLNDSDNNDRLFPARNALQKNKITQLTYHTIEKLLKYYENRSKGKYAKYILDFYKTILDNNFYVDRIKKIEYLGYKPTYDFVIPETHTFIMGGIINHNTSLMYYLCAKFLGLNGIAYFVDWEHKFHPEWFTKIANSIGVTNDKIKKGFRLNKPKHFEQFFIWFFKLIDQKIDARNKLIELARKKKRSSNDDENEKKYREIVSVPCIVVLDSIASIYTKAEVEDRTEDQAHVAEIARQFSFKLKLVRKDLGATNMLLIATNQERDKLNIGGGSFAKKGSLFTEPGGNAWKHNTDGRIKIARIKTLSRTRDGVDEDFGVLYNLKVTKNQLGIIPNKECEMMLLYNRGIFPFYSLLQSCADLKIIKREGNNFILKKGKIEIGLNELDEFLDKHPQTYDIMKNLYLKTIA